MKPTNSVFAPYYMLWWGMEWYHQLCLWPRDPSFGGAGTSMLLKSKIQGLIGIAIGLVVGFLLHPFGFWPTVMVIIGAYGIGLVSKFNTFWENRGLSWINSLVEVMWGTIVGLLIYFFGFRLKNVELNRWLQLVTLQLMLVLTITNLSLVSHARFPKFRGLKPPLVLSLMWMGLSIVRFWLLIDESTSTYAYATHVMIVALAGLISWRMLILNKTIEQSATLYYLIHTVVAFVLCGLIILSFQLR